MRTDALHLRVATWALAIAFIIIVVVGGVKVIDDTLTYITWAKQVAILAVGFGLLGIGHGIDAASRP